MKINKPKFWDSKNSKILPYLLLPFSLIFTIISSIKKKIVKKEKIEKIKTICVGNIYVGGTGKTSLSLKIHAILNQKKIKSCFIKKDYSNQIDEQKILENKGKLFKSKRRLNSLIDAADQGYEVAIFDDGLQDYSIDYDIIFLCFNDINWIGNGFTIPSGPLREKLKNIKYYNNIFINGNMENLENIKNEIFRLNPKAKIFVATYMPLNLNDFNKKDNYLVFSGIGNHQSFISMLKKNDINILKEIEYPDHYTYSDKDINDIIIEAESINCKIITTEKDFYRLHNKNIDKIRFVKSEIKIQNESDFLDTILY
tara:strand:+ start:1094 stop:2029 length:936 start_codon:yes stop_codon:yes gene_type:complete